MKFKMAAAAILNLLFLSILLKWSISGGSRLHHCKFHSSTSIDGWVIDVCAKIQDGSCHSWNSHSNFVLIECVLF